mmetsp:Transcript_40083/g.82085  ORF Transcript_40083/g.82085 Transcript_40083/m.82085 type:complete len:210 (-) Transcript_40083:189-818(-)
MMTGGRNPKSHGRNDYNLTEGITNITQERNHESKVQQLVCVHFHNTKHSRSSLLVNLGKDDGEHDPHRADALRIRRDVHAERKLHGVHASLHRNHASGHRRPDQILQHPRSREVRELQGKTLEREPVGHGVADALVEIRHPRCCPVHSLGLVRQERRGEEEPQVVVPECCKAVAPAVLNNELLQACFERLLHALCGERDVYQRRRARAS